MAIKTALSCLPIQGSTFPASTTALSCSARSGLADPLRINLKYDPSGLANQGLAVLRSGQTSTLICQGLYCTFAYVKAGSLPAHEDFAQCRHLLSTYFSVPGTAKRASHCYLILGLFASHHCPSPGSGCRPWVCMSAHVASSL